ncbi:hypothetical protein LP419_14360 [Massilia sp. H-1]|nr:hypothetical protein LP419_14360 [Massilia sp. H-1]
MTVPTKPAACALGQVTQQRRASDYAAADGVVHHLADHGLARAQAEQRFGGGDHVARLEGFVDVDDVMRYLARHGLDILFGPKIGFECEQADGGNVAEVGDRVGQLFN